MAKFRKKKSRSRAFARGKSFFRRKKSRRSSGGGMNLMGLIIGAGVYGATREFASEKLAPLTSKIPAGQYADEVGLGVASYFLAKGKIPLLNKIPYSREIGRAGLTIEAARIGAGLSQGMLPSMGASTGGVVYN